MSEERRLVTVLFADVVGSTSLGEALDPEDLRLLLRRYYAIATAVVNEYGGTLEKFIGDAVVAIFGVPRAHDDDADRAATAALRLRDRVRAEPGLGDRLPIRIGINTGKVVTNPEQHARDFVVTGDAVNMAARLQQSADAWRILAGERTARATRSIRYGPARAVDAHGHSPIVAYEVLDMRDAAPARRVPMFGREADLEQLELIARRVESEARPFVVSVTAPPGTGKTRLLDAFLEHVRERRPGARIAVARCLPYGERLTYWPIRAMLMQLLGLPDAATGDEVRAAIDAWLADIGVEPMGRTAELISATLGIGEPDAVETTDLLAAWRTALEAAARREPLIIGFDDLHWASESMLELVEFVTNPRGEARLLIVALARPELLDRRPGWGGGRRNFVSLTLEPLDESAMTQLLTHLLESPSSELVSSVQRRAEGNPFYASEIVRSVLERTGSTDDAGAIAEALATLPDTIHATLLARLDLLPVADRRILQIGSVFGDSFDAAAVAALEPALASNLAARFDYLADRQLVEPLGPGLYAFRHMLIREAAYETLPRGERARLHAAAGEWLEGLAERGTDLTELIAYHYREAATLPSALEREELDIADLRRRAVQWLTRAAEKADAAAATPESRGHLLAAIELAEPEVLPDLYERLGDVLFQGEHSVDAYRTALRLVREQRRPPEQELRIIGNLLTVFTRSQGSVASRPTNEELERLRGEGRSLLDSVTDDRARGTFLIAEAFFPFWDDRYATGEGLAAASASGEAGLELAKRLDDANLRSAALDALAGISESIGDWPTALDFSRSRLALADRLNLVERTDAHSMVVWGSCIVGELDAADAMSAAGLALAQPGQVPSWRLHLVAWRTYALLLLGRWDEAFEAAEDGRRTWHEGSLGSAGYALRGFLAGFEIARARRDPGGIERMTAVLRGICEYFPADELSGPGSAMTFVADDLDRMLDQFSAAFAWASASSADVSPGSAVPRRIEYYERVLSRLCDVGAGLPDAGLLTSVVDIMASLGYRPLEAQALRALGLATNDREPLRRAVEAFGAMGAQPSAARATAEIALLDGDDRGLTAAIRVLAAVGDIEQQERYVAAAAHR